MGFACPLVVKTEIRRSSCLFPIPSLSSGSDAPLRTDSLWNHARLNCPLRIRPATLQGLPALAMPLALTG